jgi:hypothetical protein
MRSITCPGVEIKEIDKSGYSPAMTGTKCLVMGYSDKGTPYEPMQFTSKTAWQNFYGDPDNEAERYFYNACAEVINQNGVLNCARLPYDNKSKDRMVGFKFKVSTNVTENPTAGEYLQQYPVKAWVDHDSDFEQDALRYVFDNKCLREIDGNIENGLEHDTEVTRFYNAAIKRFNKTYDLDEECARYTIDYYEVDKEESLKLQKRFLSRAEAINYLEEFRGVQRLGNYRYEVDEGEDGDYKDSSCILRDDGDWIAQPLYCKYNKEATVLEEYDYKSIDLDTIKDLKTQTELLSDKIDISKWTNIETIADLCVDVENMYKEFAPDTAEYNTICDIKAKLERYTHGGKIGEEIKNDGYLAERFYKLRDEKLNITAIDVYKKHDKDPDFKFVVNKFTKVSKWRDGADNEYLMRTVLSDLYYDVSLDLSSATDDEGISISSLYNEELWEYYKNKCLSNIIRYNQDKDAIDIDNWENIIDSWAKMLSVFKDEGGIKFEKLFSFDKVLSGSSGTTHDNAYGVYQQRVHDDVPYYRMSDLDPNLHDYLTITPSLLPIACDLTAIDEYRTGESKVAANTFWVFDKTCATLNKIPEDSRKDRDRECIGIFPVITTVANALYAQSLIQVDTEEVIDYETVTGVITKSKDDEVQDVLCCNTLLSGDVSMKFSQNDKTEDDTGVIDTVSRDANGYFSSIQMNPQGTGIDMENAKNIGVVVYKAYLDASEGNKVSFTPVEAFCGTLDKNGKNPNTGVSTFLDNIINTQSEYIYFFSNCFASTANRKTYEKVVDFFICKPSTTGMLGWFSNETSEEIALTGLYQGMEKVFTKLADVNERDIDIVCDAGLANIAQYLKSVYGGSGSHAYDLDATDDDGNPLIKAWACKSISDVGAWKTVQFKYDNFCKNTRKDCMFIADGPRPLVLQGQKKIIRDSKPSNTIDANIIPYIKYATGLNTNYGAGYCDWYLITDEFTGDEFWCPPSIKAMGVYINTDLNFNYWDAPAGLNRGVIQALDCAFSPTVKQAGSFYEKNWNYSINYPDDGIVLEGQKSFQVKPSCFDRVNVRRLFLRLERQTRKVAKYFVYEGNTAYTRQRLVDTLDPIFFEAKVGGGIYDYKIICDESINTPSVIDNNELKVKIGIKPVKTAEFILIDFVALSTGASFNEM